MMHCIALNGNDMSHYQPIAKIPNLIKLDKNVKNTQNCDESGNINI